MFKVNMVIDGDTFQVTPNWEWNNANGNRVRPANFLAPELSQSGGARSKEKLINLIQGKSVELRNPVNISYGRIVCDVFINGRDIKSLLN